MRKLLFLLAMVCVVSSVQADYLEWNPGGEGIVDATASSYYTSGSIGALLPELTVNGAGMHEDNTHRNNWEAIHWTADLGNSWAAWIQYEFDKSYAIDEMHVWNYNHAFSSGDELDRGMRMVTVSYSTDGTEFADLGEFEFAKATGEYRYEHNTEIDFGGVEAKFVKIACISYLPEHNWGDSQLTGLSEVGFVPVPEPLTLSFIGLGAISLMRRRS